MSTTQHPAPAPLERLLTAPEVAELLDVPLGTIYAWSTRGLGPAKLRLGRHLRYDPADIRAWLDAQRQGGGGRNATP